MCSNMLEQYITCIFSSKMYGGNYFPLGVKCLFKITGIQSVQKRRSRAHHNHPPIVNITVSHEYYGHLAIFCKQLLLLLFLYSHSIAQQVINVFNIYNTNLYNTIIISTRMDWFFVISFNEYENINSNGHFIVKIKYV